MSFNKISFLSAITLFGSLTVAGPVASIQLPNVPSAKYGDKPAPFTLKVDPKFIEQTRCKVENARLPDNVDAFGYNDGPGSQNATDLKNFWAKKFDWSKTEGVINKKFKQFTTTVTLNPKDAPAGLNYSYTDPVPLHFVHHKSSQANAIPLLFLHGWPGSFLEVTNIIDELTNPSDKNQQAFHVVAPSIPGFGFSPAPTKPGFGLVAAADVFNELMTKQLGYKKYVTQGGDLGGDILRFLGGRHTESNVAFLSNFWPIAPSAKDTLRAAANQTSAQETKYIATVNQYVVLGSGYRFMQQTQPVTLAYSLGDSPLGFALWIYAIMRRIVDPNITPTLFTAASPTGYQEIITWAMMYLIQGPLGGFRLYKEAFNDGAYAGVGFGNFPYCKVPVAVSEFPYDISGVPKDWAQREGNVQDMYLHTKGGHFAAYEVPDLMVADIRKWFADERSGVPAAFKSSK